MSTKRIRKRVESALQDDNDNDALPSKPATVRAVRTRITRSADTRSRKIVIEDPETIAQWTSVGVSRRLSSDADIARFLLSLCSDVKEKQMPADAQCAVCEASLVLYCLACHLSSSASPSVKPPQTSQIPLSKAVREDWELSGSSPPLFQASIRSSRTAGICAAAVSTSALGTSLGSVSGGDRENPVSQQPVSSDAAWGLQESERVLQGNGLVNGFHGKGRESAGSVGDVDAEDSDSSQAINSGEPVAQESYPRKGVHNLLTLSGEAQLESLHEFPAEREQKDCLSQEEAHETEQQDCLSQEEAHETEQQDCLSQEEAQWYVCPPCGLHLPNSQHKAHVKTHHSSLEGGGRFSCEACSRTFPQFQALYSHSRLSTGDQTCRCCGEALRSGCQVTAHRKQHARERARFCPHCRRSFPSLTKKDFDRHIKKHEKQQKGKPTEAVLCPQCGKVFKKKDDLNHHLTYHSKDSPFACTLCPKAFKNRACLRQHQLFHGEKTQQCEVCGAKFYRKAGLRRHMQKHTGKQYTCDECARRFCSPTELQVHVDAVHKGIRPFSCNQCELKFYKAASLKIHTRTHTGEKPFSCDRCPARFSVGEALRKHTRRHTGEKPFCCEDCGQRYACQYSYKLHRKKHHTDRQYPCLDCQQVFVMRSSLNFHRKMCHNGRWDKDTEDNQLSGQVLELQAVSLLQ